MGICTEKFKYLLSNDTGHSLDSVDIELERWFQSTESPQSTQEEILDTNSEMEKKIIDVLYNQEDFWLTSKEIFINFHGVELELVEQALKRLVEKNLISTRDRKFKYGWELTAVRI